MDRAVITLIALIVYIALISLIGIYNRKSKNSEEYFFAGRKLSPSLLAITFIASWWGGGSAIDLVDQAHRIGISSFWIYGVPVLIATAGMWVLSGIIRRSSGFTQPQMLIKRYGPKSALLLSIFILISMILSAAVQVIVIGNMFQLLFHWSYPLAATVGTLGVLIYSFFGGFKGVVLTDLLQFVLFLFASVFLFFYCYDKADGFQPMLQEVSRLDKVGYTSFFYKLTDNLPYIITFGSAWVIQANVWQRMSAARSPRDAKRMMGLSFFIFIPLYLMVTLTGMLSFTLFDTIPEGGIVMAIIGQIQQPVIAVLLFVGLCSAIMSTMDSLINTASLTATIDIYQTHFFPNCSQKQMVTIGRISTLFIALLALFIGIRIRSVLQVSWIGGDFLATGAFVPIIMGFIWKKGKEKAALGSMVWGLCFSTYNLLVSLGLPFPTYWKIASAQQAFLGMAISFVIYMALAFSEGKKEKI